MDWHKKTLFELSQSLEKQEVSSLELTQYFLSRIKALDNYLNSFITVTETLAIEQAKKADQIRTKHKASRLSGIPFAHKDIFCTEGIKTSCASKMLDNFISPYNATVTEKLYQAGMVMLGKTNMDEFAMGASNETSYYGRVANPWDLERVPGGSSGGSAAAVAARFIPMATGTDTGGSVRQPAALCGITGLKPTYGRISRRGMIAFASSLDHAGILTQTALDAAMILQAIAGFDEWDSTSAAKPTPDYVQALEGSIEGLKIGLPAECFSKNLNSEIMEPIVAAARALEKEGAILSEINLPNLLSGVPVYYILASAECSSNLARYDGVRYGYRCTDSENLEDLYQRTRSEGFGREVKRRILLGTYVLSSGYYDAYYLKAQKVRAKISSEFKEAFKHIDVILMPTSPSTAFKFNTKNDPVSLYLADLYTTAANLAGLPSISIPVGFSRRLPIGMQLLGNAFEEAKILKTAYRYQQISDWHTHLPSGFE